MGKCVRVLYLGFGSHLKKYRVMLRIEEVTIIEKQPYVHSMEQNVSECHFSFSILATMSTLKSKPEP